jgi:hypothetical protein
MRVSAFLVLLGAARTLGASSPYPPPSHPSPFPSSPSLPLSFSPHSLSIPLPSYSSPFPTFSQSSSSSSGGGTSYSPLSSSQTQSSSGSGVLAQSLLPNIPISSYTFVPFPSPSSGPPVPGVYPLASPKTPPPVDNPALVPDFAPAWTKAYEEARAKVSA